MLTEETEGLILSSIGLLILIIAMIVMINEHLRNKYEVKLETLCSEYTWKQRQVQKVEDFVASINF